jgi:hypothetical protein
MMPEPAIAISGHTLVPGLDEDLVRVFIVDMSPERGLRDLKPSDSPQLIQSVPFGADVPPKPTLETIRPTASYCHFSPLTFEETAYSR